MAKGQTFLNEPDETSRGEIRHLNVVITDPDSENEVLVVPVCTYKEMNGRPFPGMDTSCLLPAGCHPFVKFKSYINYGKAKSMNLIAIFNGLQKGLLIRQQDFAAQYVQDMQRGAEESLYIPGKFKRFFDYFL